MNRALTAAFGLLPLGVGLGQVTPVDLNVSHATQTLYWGWASLALFTLFFERVGAAGRCARWVSGALAAQGLATFVVFLHSGYGRPGVALPALTLVPFVAGWRSFFARLTSCAARTSRASALRRCAW